MSCINLLFCTPLFRGKLSGVEKLNESLEELILSLEEEQNRKLDSPQPMHGGVFESEFDFLSRPEPVVQEFKKLVYDQLGEFVKEVNQLTEDDLTKLKFDNHCWFHVTRKGGYFQSHNHPNASWSFTYYVTPGDEQVEDEKAAGHIVLADPRPQASCYMDVANKNMRRDLSFSSVRFRPQASELLIFPSYLQHWVEPYSGEAPRISISANFWFYQ